MSRLLSFTIALAIAAAVFGASTSVLAQPAVTTPSSTASTAPKTPEYPELLKAQQLLNERNLPEAIKELHNAALKYPKLPSEWVMLYDVLARNNQPNAARQFLERAIIETPSDPEPWVIFGNLALQDNRLAESEIDFAKANQLLETYKNVDRKGVIQQQALSGMAAVSERRERWADAQARLEKFLETAPDDYIALQRLARAKFWQGKVKEAYADLQKAKQIDLDKVAKDTTLKAREQMLPAAAVLAQYYDMFERKNPWPGKSENADKWFKYALKQAPNDLNLRAVVTVWALENGEIEFAKEQAKEALRIEKDDPKKYAGSTAGRMLSGYVAIWDKKWPQAQDYFEKVFIEAPNDFAVKNNLALALVEQDESKKKERALEYALGNYQANKDNVEAASTLAWVYFKNEKFDLASAAMDAVIRATGGNVSNADTATYLAHVLYHNGTATNGLKYRAKLILKAILDAKRPFSMKPEAQKLYDLVKDEKAPETPTPTASKTP
jgi:tetratricopeptide (TPR) repeat protein